MSMLELEVNRSAQTANGEKKYSLGIILSMLFSRVALFILFQLLLYAVFRIGKIPSPWGLSASFWPLNVAAANLVCVFLLHRLLKREGKSFRDFFEYRKGEFGKLFLTMSAVMLLSFPIVYLPIVVLGNVLFGNQTDAVNLLYRPLPVWAAWVQCIAFPLTMPLGELTVYYGYVMPRLEVITKKKWLSFALPALILSFQHVALPLLFDVRFMVWRLFMFLPFAVLLGLVVRWKPKLFPYILIGHFFIDLMTAVSILTISLAA